MSIPTPGKPVRGSKSGGPLMAVFDLLGRTWAMGLVWQLQDGPHTFRQIQERCESISPTILNVRLKDLGEAGIVERTLQGYQLTQRGEKLLQLLLPFEEWALTWAREMFQFTRK